MTRSSDFNVHTFIEACLLDGIEVADKNSAVFIGRRKNKIKSMTYTVHHKDQAGCARCMAVIAASLNVRGDNEQLFQPPFDGLYVTLRYEAVVFLPSTCSS